jgi:hypothetical protein
VIFTEGPYMTGLYHRPDCWWVCRAPGWARIVAKRDAEAGFFTAHLDCVLKPAGANRIGPNNAVHGTAVVPYVGQSDAERAPVHLKATPPYLNGLYHKVGCWWLTRGGGAVVTRTLHSLRLRAVWESHKNRRN